MKLFAIVVLLSLLGLGLSDKVSNFSNKQMNVTTHPETPYILDFSLNGKNGGSDLYEMSFLQLLEIDKSGDVVRKVEMGNLDFLYVEDRSHHSFIQANATAAIHDGGKNCVFMLYTRLYNSSSDTTAALFGNLTDEEKAVGNSLVFAVAIANYEFKNDSNTLNLTSTVLARTEKKEGAKNETKIRTNKDTGVEALTFLYGTDEDQTLFMNFPTEIGVDNKITGKGFMVNVATPTKAELQITYTFPHFTSMLVMDPDVGFQDHALSSSKPTKKIWIWVAIIGGVIAAVILAAIVITIVRRQRKSTYEEI